MQRNNNLQHYAEMPAPKRRKAGKRIQISVQKLIEHRQVKIKNHTKDVDLSLLKHLKDFSGKNINVGFLLPICSISHK